MSITKIATSSFPLRLISPENLLTYADQIAVETDADGKMTKSQAQFNAELRAGGGGGGITLNPYGGLKVEAEGVTLSLGNGFSLNDDGALTLNIGSEFSFITPVAGQDQFLSLSLGSGITRDSAGRPTLNIGTGLTLGSDGILTATNSGSGIIIQ